MIAEDLNESIKADDVQEFFRIIGVDDIYSKIHNKTEGECAPIYKCGKKCIDTIASSHGLLIFIQNCQELDFNKITLTDHKGLCIGIDINSYFKTRTSKFDNNKPRQLNPK